MNSQELILGRIETAIGADQRFVLVKDAQYANTGTLRTFDAETLEQVAAVSYSFQDGYCRFAQSQEPIASLRYGSPETGTAAWVKRSIPELTDTVVDFLRGGR